MREKGSEYGIAVQVIEYESGVGMPVEASRTASQNETAEMTGHFFGTVVAEARSRALNVAIVAAYDQAASPDLAGIN